jgi:hypothetical protein
MSEDEEDEQIKTSNSSKPAGFSTSLDNLDREYLQQQFFNLNKNS